MEQVLIVDDQESIQTSLTLILEGDYQILTAGSGLEALEKVSRYKPSLVFLDIHMPGMDGIETLRRIKEIDAHLPVVVVSGSLDGRMMETVTNLGASGFIHKPFDVDQISLTARKVLESSSFL